MTTLRITQTKSYIGLKPKTRGTLRALGLRGIGQSRDHVDKPDLQGMLAKVSHLVTIEEVQEAKK